MKSKRAFGSIAMVFGLMAAVEAAHANSVPVGSMMRVDYRALVSSANPDIHGICGDMDAKQPGLPIGNGRLGTLLWQPTASVLALQPNHSDVFAFRSSSVARIPGPWDGAHDNYGNFCGQVRIDFGEDVFTPETTRNQLDVYDALCTVSGAGVTVRGMAWNAKDVMALEITDRRAEPKPITVELAMLLPPERKIGPHTEISTVAAVEGDMELTQQFLEPPSQPYAKDLQSFTALRTRAIGRKAETRVDKNSGCLTVPAGQGSFVVLFSVGHSMENPLETVRADAKAQLDTAAALGFDKLLADNRAYWQDYWTKSFVNMSGTPELEEMTKFNLWGDYLAGCCMRGNFPPKHNYLLFLTQWNRVWGSNLEWWYNQSAQQGWQFAANRIDLLEPVFRWNQYARAGYESAARQGWNSRGWHIPEVSSWDGPEILPEGQHTPQGHRALVHQSLMGTPFTARNTYNTAKFAALYYKKYLYTGDEQWLKERAYPALRDTAEFYCGLKAGCEYAGGKDWGKEGKVILKKDADGKYHLYGTMSHEHIWWGKDIIEDLAAIRGIFPVAIELSKKFGVDADKRAEWQEVLDNLAPYPMSDMPGAIAGLGPGTWCQGLAPHGNLRGNMNSESPRMGPVVGCFLDVLTMESPDKAEWATAMKTLDKHPGTVNKRITTASGYYVIVPARMGRADLVEYALPEQYRRSLGHSNIGMSHSLQGQGNFKKALYAALLLSIAPGPADVSIIHVMPSWPRKWNVSFQLLAKGGFLVSSSMKSGEIGFVEILSQIGGACRIRNPWPGKEVALFVNGKKRTASKDDLLVFHTEKGQEYVLVPADKDDLEARKVTVPSPALPETARGSGPTRGGGMRKP